MHSENTDSTKEMPFLLLKSKYFYLLILCFLPLGNIEEGYADDIFDVEHARTLERSGMPLSENNMWYLKRWGGIGDPPLRSNTIKRDEEYLNQRKSEISSMRGQRKTNQ